jgi:D-sedoheptulose 7-phosphate isomerase
MNTLQLIQSHIQDSIAAKTAILATPALMADIEKTTSVITDAYRKGNKTLLAGNGGSAADAQHIAGELVSRFYFDRPGLPAIALHTDTSILTAIGNDYGYEQIFSRQVQAQGVAGDVFIGITTSGNSANILQALRVCREKGIFTIGFTGASGGKMADWCDICLKVPSKDTPRIQESHIMIGHIICCVVEQNLFGSE